MNLLTHNEEGEELRHDYLIKIGSYEMIFEQQKTQIHALKQWNKELEKGVENHKHRADMMMYELEEYDGMKDTYHKLFCN
jgi:hypothetical protein